MTTIFTNATAFGDSGWGTAVYYGEGSSIEHGGRGVTSRVVEDAAEWLAWHVAEDYVV